MRGNEVRTWPIRICLGTHFTSKSNYIHRRNTAQHGAQEIGIVPARVRPKSFEENPDVAAVFEASSSHNDQGNTYVKGSPSSSSQYNALRLTSICLLKPPRRGKLSWIFSKKKAADTNHQYYL